MWDVLLGLAFQQTVVFNLKLKFKFKSFQVPLCPVRTKSHCVKVDPWHSIKLLKPVYHSQTHCGLKLSSKMQAGTLLDHSLVRSDKLQHKTMEKRIDICLVGVWKWFWAKSFIQSFWRSSRTELCHFLWRPALPPAWGWDITRFKSRFLFSIKEKFCGSLQASVVSRTFKSQYCEFCFTEF